MQCRAGHWARTGAALKRDASFNKSYNTIAHCLKDVLNLRPYAQKPSNQTGDSDMGILSNIFGKIFPSSHKSSQPTAQTTSVPPPAQPTAGTAPAAPAPAAMQEVDVEAILDDMSKKSSQKLNWRTSIVDLLKLLDIDSSLQARKDLARELNYSGSTEDSASMNIWLHKQVMTKLAQNGGKVPADLRD